MQITPLFEAHKDFVLSSRVLHGDETTVKLLDPGAGKTKTAYMWAYARGVFDPLPGVVYNFCPGRGAQFPYKFLPGWSGTLVRRRLRRLRKGTVAGRSTRRRMYGAFETEIR